MAITNKVPNATKLAKWTCQHLKDAMDVVEKGHMFLQKVTRYWNIPFTSFSNRPNGRTRSRKVGPQDVLTKGICNNYHLGFEHVNYWIIYHPSTTKAEGC